MNLTKEGLVKFVNWTKIKIRIHFSERKFYPRERQIWWVSLGQNIGTEINGKNERFERPVLVLKRYHTETCLVLPLSSKIKIGNYYMNFRNQRGEINTINFSQIRSVSTKRFIRMIGKIGEEDFDKVRLLVRKLI